MTLRVAYLVNQYPSVSHTFIRREIHALERQGVAIQRVSIRGWDSPLVDEADRQERAITRYVLKDGILGLVGAVLRTALGTPARLFSATLVAMRMAKGSDRPLVVHLAYLAEACVIRGWLEVSGATHLHAHFATNPAEIAMLVNALGGPPYSFTAHGSDIMDRPAQIGLDQTVGRASFVCGVCRFGVSQLYKWTSYRLWSKVHVVRCGLERGYGASAGSGVRISKRLVCIGRLSREKGQVLLIQAASKLAANRRDFELVLVGDGPMRLELESVIAEHKLGHMVRITGWLDTNDIEAELCAARALVVPSLSEGLPVVIMEAMAHRVPVVAPYLAGIPELVADQRTGWLFPTGDAGALAGAMDACLNANDALLSAMGEQGHRRVWEAHDVDVEAGKLAALFTSPSQTAHSI